MSQKVVEHLVKHAAKHFTQETVKHAAHEEKHSPWTALCLMIVGLFLVPAGIGLFILPWGIYKFVKAISG
jgi:hypothetical protein